jgi:serine/threonine-protein kinase
VLGRYRIVTPLARGGMGIIYLGRLEGAAGFAKPVVIKTVIPDAKDDKSAQLFAREARIVSNLEHPNIVGVLDFGEADGEYVMVLEYVHGFHLGFWLRYVQETRRDMSIAHAVEVMLPALDALDFAHRLKRADGTELGIVHRDVSPANILIDHMGHVKLHDFGIARMADDEFKTQDGTFRGTLSFTAPETLQGIAASPRSDMYACGVVLYQLIAGSNPFRGQQPSETLHKVITHVPPRLRTIREEVGEALSDAIACAMEKDPAKRFDSAGSFAEALRAARTWPEADALASLQRVIHDDFTGDAMPRLLGLETLQSRDTAWRAGGARTALSSSRPPALTRRESGTVTADVPSAALPDPLATIQALPSSALLELARAGSGGGEPTIVAKPADLLVPAAATVAPPKRRAGLLLGLGGVAVLAAGAALYPLLRPKDPPPAPRFLLIEKQADVPGEMPATSASGGEPVAPNVAPNLAGSATAPGPSLVASGSGRPPKAGEVGAGGSSLSSAFQRQRGRVEGCFRSHAGDLTEQPQLTVRFQIAATGAVHSAELVPAGMSGSPLGACILGVARSTKFPAGDGPVSFTIPITARKTGG